MKKVIAVLGNDYHLGANNLDLVEEIWYQHLEQCVQRQAVMIIGGDMFTNRSGQPLSVLTLFKELRAAAIRAGVEVRIIPGNHDKTDGNSELSYLDVFESPGNDFYICSQGGWEKIGGVDFCLIPYFGNERWMERFQTVAAGIDGAKKTSPRILITHMGVEGVRNNDGTIVSSPIKPSLFKPFDKVLIGHYHDSSQLGHNVFYTGSVYQNNFGEEWRDKGFTLIYNTGEIEFVPSKFPRYIKETLDVKDGASLQNVLEKHGDLSQGKDFVRLVFKGKKEDLQNLNKVDLEARGYSIQFLSDEQSTAMETAETTEIAEYDKKALLKDFAEYCKTQKIAGAQFKYGYQLINAL